ncbi:MAG: hypothetical protein M1358_09020 [Chloroflexi bacterium]|nr:hypothetical protein [Chloroflexota bacterium]
MPVRSLNESIHFYSDTEWQSGRGTLSVDGECLVFRNCREVVIPLLGINTVATIIPRQLIRMGFAASVVADKPPTMLFLHLEYEIESDNYIGEIKRKTAFLGSVYCTAQEANQQIVRIRLGINHARADIIHKYHIAPGPVRRDADDSLKLASVERANEHRSVLGMVCDLFRTGQTRC